MFEMSGLLHAMIQRWSGSGSGRTLRVDVNPSALQVLVDYAECRVAVDSGVDRVAPEILQALASQILGDGSLRWAAHRLNIDLGIVVPPKPWSVSPELVKAVTGNAATVDMQSNRDSYGEAVVLIALMTKEHDFPDVLVSLTRGHGENYRGIQAETLTLTTSDRVQVTFQMGSTSDNWQTRSSYFLYKSQESIRQQLTAVKSGTALYPFVSQMLRYLVRQPVPAHRVF